MINFGNNIRFIDFTIDGTYFTCFKMDGDVRFFDNHIKNLNLNSYFITGYCRNGADDPDWSNTIFRDNIFNEVNFEAWNGNEYNGVTFLCNSFTNSYLEDTDFTRAHFQTVSSVYNLNTGAFQGYEVCEQTFTDSYMKGSSF